MIKEHDCVALTCDLSEHGLKRDDVGTAVHIHNGGAAYEVEFVTLTGETVAIVTLEASQVRPTGHRDIPHARKLASRDRRVHWPKVDKILSRVPDVAPTSGDEV